MVHVEVSAEERMVLIGNIQNVGDLHKLKEVKSNLRWHFSPFLRT